MARVVLTALFALWLTIGTATAQTCGSLTNIQNGTTADAGQVMNNFNTLLACVSAAQRSYLAGLTLSNDGTTPATVIDVSAGVATDSTNTVRISLGAFTKSAGGSWVAGTGMTGMGTGVTISNSTWYHVCAIINAGAADIYFDTDAACTSNSPPSTTARRRIGSLKTDSSSHIVLFTQIGDEFIWAVSPNDVALTNVGTGARTLVSLPSVPPGVKVNALIRAGGNSSASAIQWIITSPDETDQAVGPTGAGVDVVSQVTGVGAFGRFNVRTSTSGQIGVRAGAGSNSFEASTFGWIDTRGRFN